MPIKIESGAYGWMEWMDNGYPFDCFDCSNTCGAKNPQNLQSEFNYESYRFDSRLRFRGLKEEEHKNWVTKEENISEKEKQLQEMRERTRRLLEKSRQKEQEFEASTKNFNETIKANEPPEPKKATMKEKLKSKVSDKAKGMSEMAKAMKEEMRRKREEARKDEEDDLLAFLRKSHKEKVGIIN